MVHNAVLLFISGVSILRQLLSQLGGAAQHASQLHVPHAAVLGVKATCYFAMAQGARLLFIMTASIPHCLLCHMAIGSVGHAC